MKKLSVLVVLLLSVSTLFAHDFLPQCSQNGRALVQCSDFGHDGTKFLRFTITTPGVTWGNGSQDTVFVFTGPVFNIWIPQPTSTNPTQFRYANLKHDYHGSAICTHELEFGFQSTISCGDLPVVLGNVTYERDLKDRNIIWTTVEVLETDGNSTLRFNFQHKDNSIKYAAAISQFNETVPGIYVFKIRYNWGQFVVLTYNRKQ